MRPIYIVPLAGLSLALAGCVTRQRIQPAVFIPTRSPEVVWVTTNDNVRTPVAQPRIVGDSLEGTRPRCGQPVAISLKEINYVQATRPSPKRTALLVTVVGAAVTGVGYMVATSDRVSLSNCTGYAKGITGDYCGP